MKGRYKRILVALDESEQAEGVFVRGLTIARCHQATVFFAYIEEQMISYRNKAELRSELEELAKDKLLKQLVKAQTHGLKKAEALVGFGNPKTYLAEEIPLEYGIDLIVIGATKAGTVSRLLGGSTTDYVVKHAPCSVMVVR